MSRSPSHVFSVLLMLLVCIGAYVVAAPSPSLWLIPLVWFVLELFISVMTLL